MTGRSFSFLATNVSMCAWSANNGKYSRPRHVCFAEHCEPQIQRVGDIRPPAGLKVQTGESLVLAMVDRVTKYAEAERCNAEEMTAETIVRKIMNALFAKHGTRKS